MTYHTAQPQIIFPCITYGCETWSLTMREEERWRQCLRTGCWENTWA